MRHTSYCSTHPKFSPKSAVTEGLPGKLTSRTVGPHLSRMEREKEILGKERGTGPELIGPMKMECFVPFKEEGDVIAAWREARSVKYLDRKVGWRGDQTSIVWPRTIGLLCFDMKRW